MYQLLRSVLARTGVGLTGDAQRAVCSHSPFGHDAPRRATAEKAGFKLTREHVDAASLRRLRTVTDADDAAEAASGDWVRLILLVLDESDEASIAASTAETLRKSEQEHEATKALASVRNQMSQSTPVPVTR